MFILVIEKGVFSTFCLFSTIHPSTVFQILSGICSEREEEVKLWLCQHSGNWLKMIFSGAYIQSMVVVLQFRCRQLIYDSSPATWLLCSSWKYRGGGSNWLLQKAPLPVCTVQQTPSLIMPKITVIWNRPEARRWQWSISNKMLFN